MLLVIREEAQKQFSEDYDSWFFVIFFLGGSGGVTEGKIIGFILPLIKVFFCCCCLYYI